MCLRAMFAMLCACAALSSLMAGGDVQSDTPRGEAAPARIGGIVFAGGDGSSMDKAVLIKNAKGEVEGVAAEYQWLARTCPGYKLTRQAMLSQGGRSYDMIEFTDAQGQAKAIYFDITAFFGK